MAFKSKRERASKKEAQKPEFKPAASCEVVDMALVDWDVLEFEGKDGSDLEKVLAKFSANEGEGEILVVEMFGKTADAWTDSDPAEGEIFDLSLNVFSAEAKNKDGETIYFNRVRAWRFDAHDKPARNSRRGNGRR